MAEIYGYDVKRLNEQVKRNINRFPEDFMFQLKASEITDSLKSQFATLNVSENKRGINTDSLRFVEYKDDILEMNCYEFCNWSNNVTLFLDCDKIIK